MRKVDLWVCPECHILWGINVVKYGDTYRYSCHSCGLNLKIGQIQFLDEYMVDMTYRRLEAELEGYADARVYRWMSNRTVGLVIDGYRDDFEQQYGPEKIIEIEDDIAAELELTITVTFEFD